MKRFQPPLLAGFPGDCVDHSPPVPVQSPLWLGLLEGRAHVCMQPAPCLVLAKVSVQNLSLFSFPGERDYNSRAPAFNLLDRDLEQVQLLALLTSSRQRQTSKQEVPFDHISPGRETVAINRRKGLTLLKGTKLVCSSLHFQSHQRCLLVIGVQQTLVALNLGSSPPLDFIFRISGQLWVSLWSYH